MSFHLRQPRSEPLYVTSTPFRISHFAFRVSQYAKCTSLFYLHSHRVTPRLVWDNVKTDIVSHERGCSQDAKR